MKTEHLLAVLAAILAPCLATPGQTVATPSPMPVPPLVSTDTGAPTNTAAAEEVVDVVAFDGVALTDAIRTLALQAGLNIQFDPKLLISPDGHPITPPNVTEKWHKLTAMQALQALLDNWDWQLTWDPRTKVGRVSAKNLSAKEPLVTAVVALRYANPTNIVPEVRESLSTGSTVIPDVRTHQLILRTTEKELFGVEALITKLDTATRQVLVEAKLIETTKDITSAKGVDWTGTLQNQHISFGNGLTQGTIQSQSGSVAVPAGTTSTTSPGGSPITGSSGSVQNVSSNVTSLTTSILGLPAQGGGFSMNTAHGFSPATAFLNADGVQAVLSFLNTDNDTKTISFPRSVALDGEETELAVVQNIPVFSQTQSAPAGGSASGLATVQPNYALAGPQGTVLNEVGVKLVVTPRIAGPTNVLLDLKPEISQQSGVLTETLNGQPNQAPEFSRTRILTKASVPSGYTLVLGGMDQDVVNKTYTKVPFFGDIPGLGNLFRSDSKSHQSETVLIFVTPTIISDSDYQPTEVDFLKRKATPPGGAMDSAWDSGEPYDWTKPKSRVSPAYQP